MIPLAEKPPLWKKTIAKASRGVSLSKSAGIRIPAKRNHQDAMIHDYADRKKGKKKIKKGKRTVTLEHEERPQDHRAGGDWLEEDRVKPF